VPERRAHAVLALSHGGSPTSPTNLSSPVLCSAHPLQAYPLAELTLFLAQWNLATNVVKLAANIVSTVASSLSLSGSIISLTVAAEVVATANPPPAPRNSTSTGNPDGFLSGVMALNGNVDSHQLIDRMIRAAAAVE
jgi:hypothetical protein